LIESPGNEERQLQVFFLISEDRKKKGTLKIEASKAT
jgi:hypothetical protein